MINTHDYAITRFYSFLDKDCNCPVVTFQVTDDCCLNCSYCYQINKGHRMMSREIGKQGIDLLFKMYDENDEQAFINHHTKGIIFDFIGGEPFMNIDVIQYITEYFINQCIEKNHPWLTTFRIAISSNGLLYFEKTVQEYLNKYKDFIALNITIDGPKELHDSCRVDYSNQGSFDKVFQAWEHWNKNNLSSTSTKITFAPENLKYLEEIFTFFLNHNVINIYGNPIYEHEWTPEEAKIYYDKLIILANILLNRKIKINTNIFEPNIGHPLRNTDQLNFCGGNGKMLAFDPDGIAYPCLRYMESSLGTENEPIQIGNVKDGLYNTDKEKYFKEELNKINRLKYSDDECLNCHIASGCGSCLAWDYQKAHCFNKKSKGICWMHRARTLANVYYWNQYYLQNSMHTVFPLYLSRDIATQIISNEEFDKLLSLTHMR